MTRAAIYARMSTDKQSEASLADQVPECRRSPTPAIEPSRGAVSLDTRRRAFAQALGRLVARHVLRELGLEPEVKR
jgi:hypothetical protein